TKFSYRARTSDRLPCSCHCGVGRMPAASSMPRDDCSPTSTVRLGLDGSCEAMFLRRISNAATVALPLPSQKSNLLPTSTWRPVVSSLLLRTSANEAEASEPEGGSAALEACAYRLAPGAMSHTTPTRPVV